MEVVAEILSRGTRLEKPPKERREEDRDYKWQEEHYGDVKIFVGEELSGDYRFNLEGEKHSGNYLLELSEKGEEMPELDIDTYIVITDGEMDPEDIVKTTIEEENPVETDYEECETPVEIEYQSAEAA